MRQINDQKKNYEQPTIKVVELGNEEMICQSPGSTEGYGINQQSLDDDDFE